MITISNNAKKRLLELLGSEEEAKQFVRVGVESGGCCYRSGVVGLVVFNQILVVSVLLVVV